MREMQIKIPTAGFEGPLDLLLHLIKQLEIDIYDIPMAEVTEQYMLYIQTMQELELDVASEYLVMAATLVAIKSRMILPRHEENREEDLPDMDEEDPREELVARLLEYKKFKEAAQKLKEREQERALFFTKPPSDLSAYASNPAPTYNGEKVTIYDMLGAYHKLLRRKRLRQPLYTKVERQDISIEERMTEVLDVLQSAAERVHFFSLFPYRTKEQIVVTFLAILELMRQNKVFAEQEEICGDIWLYAVYNG